MSESSGLDKRGMQTTARREQYAGLTIHAIRTHYDNVAGCLSAADAVGSVDGSDAGKGTDDRTEVARHGGPPYPCPSSYVVQARLR